MFIFADTEFTDFKNTELISVGLVSEDDQHEFYREVSHIADFRSDFVNQVVIPLCDREFNHPDVVSLDMRDWIDSLPGDQVTIVVDYVGDWHLIEPLLKKNPPRKRVQAQMFDYAFWNMLSERGYTVSPAMQGRVFNALTAGISEYYSVDPRQHHALVDAKANRCGWIKGMGAV